MKSSAHGHTNPKTLRNLWRFVPRRPRLTTGLAIGLVAVGLAVAATHHNAPQWAPAAAHRAATARVEATAPRADLSALPLTFEANLGQAPEQVEYLAHGSGYAIGLSGSGASLSFAREPAQPAATRELIRLQLTGASALVRPVAEQPLPGRVNYLIGNDRARWRTDISTYGKVRYAGVYPGVDVVYYGNQGHLEYDFAVAPGASTKPIGLHFEGADALRTDAAGNLQVTKGSHQMVFERPVAYQLEDGQRHLVAAAYRVEGRAIGFDLGAYDHSRALVIDPVLSYLSYLGGSSTESIGNVTGYGASGVTNFTPAAAVDSGGNLYVVGSTYSTNFPTVGGRAAPPGKFQGQSKTWVFVSKIAPDASSLVYSTYIGGSFNDYGNAIAVDAAGSAYVTGSTDSADFPVTGGAFQTICAPTNGHGGPEPQNCLDPVNPSVNQWGNAFVAKLNAAGNALTYSTFLGTGNTVGEAIAVDSAGRAYVVGNSPQGYCGGGNPSYLCFPTTTGAVIPDQRGWVQSGFNDSYAFVTVFNAAGSSLQYSTLYGDKDLVNTHLGFFTVGTAVAVDAAGNFYLGGQTEDGKLPTTSGSLQPVPGPSDDANGDVNGIRAFVAKFSPVSAGSSTQVYGTYLGGTTAGTADFISGLAADAAGDAFAYGWTSDNAFPVTAGAYQTTCAVGGAGLCANATFIAKLNPSGSSLLWATFFGDATGSGDGISGSGAIALDAAGNSYITGVAAHLLPQVNPIQAASASNGQAFAAKFDASGSHLLFSTLMGGLAGSQEGSGIAVDTSGNIYVAGNTNSAGFTTTSGVFQAAFGGTSGTGFNAFSGDGFVARISSLITATHTALTASSASATSGTAIVLTATVTPNSGSGTPTGTVTFKDGTSTLGTGTLNGTGVAMYTANALAVGAHAITAAYGGDSADTASASTAVTVTITSAVPAAPTGVTATAGNAQVALAWTASSGATSYNVYQGTSAGGESSTAVQTGISGTSATVTGLTNGTAYYFTIAAVNANGTGPASAEASATPVAPSGGGGGGGSSGGGGGAFDIWALLALAALVVMQLTRQGVASAHAAARGPVTIEACRCSHSSPVNLPMA